MTTWDSFNTSDLWFGTLFLSLPGIHLHSLKSKLKAHLISSAYWSVLFFSCYQPTTSNACIWCVCMCVCVFCVSVCLCVYVYACVHVCDEMSIPISLCKCSGLLWDGDAINNLLLLLHEQEHETRYQRWWQQYAERGTYHTPTQPWWWIAEGTADICTPEYNKKSWTSKISPDSA